MNLFEPPHTFIYSSEAFETGSAVVSRWCFRSQALSRRRPVSIWKPKFFTEAKRTPSWAHRPSSNCNTFTTPLIKVTKNNVEGRKKNIIFSFYIFMHNLCGRPSHWVCQARHKRGCSTKGGLDWIGGTLNFDTKYGQCHSLEIEMT